MSGAEQIGPRRVAITGLGVISPLGIGKQRYWQGLVDGRSATKHLSKVESCDLYDGFEFGSNVLAEVEDFDPVAVGLPEEVQRLDRFIQFAVAGAMQAIGDAALDVKAVERDRFGIVLSTAICGTRQMEREFIASTDRGQRPVDPTKVGPDLYLASMSNTPSVILAALTGARGPCITLSTGCIGGVDAIGYAFESIRYGEADVVVAGASEAPITPITTASFEIINCLSRRHNDRPATASRPFDADRDGFVLAEGCGVVVLEEWEHALARGAHVYAEITGFDLSCNALHMTDLLSDGADLARTMTGALDDGGLAAESVDHVNAHGSSTPQNDRCETKALVLALGEHARRIPINSTKSMTGHPLSAASAQEIVGCALALERGYIHPTINYERPDPECDLDYVPNTGRPWRGDVVLSDASGFSGLHATLVLRSAGAPA
ncbi:beta-ketoacyl-[acyl-carrier-protein] synthase family protein [Phytohabitans sp. LJ34]|uniref:beta-ketoacyl-[acyl-carrier-protein] synthase family protein n=1 Tax=Phytohabitans sp. LJ34 TaxID=3452217 RepID=UPI003F895CA8